MDAAKLIEVRKRWVGLEAMAGAMGINKVTLWRRETTPGGMDAEFLARYAKALRTQISPQVQEALADLNAVSEAAIGAA